MRTLHESGSAVFDSVREALTPEPVDHEVIIVGAGFGGLGAAIECGRLGMSDVVVLDRADGVGGTWHANTYPGVAVDIASATYSYSFAPNPDWSRIYAPGAELKRYAERIVDDHGLRPLLRLGREVTATRWDEPAQRWTVETAEHGNLTARILIVASGVLSQPKKPDIAGLERFTGRLLHTARWPAGEDLAGCRVAVIGTGATAVQAIPELADTAAHLTVFQRTPIWVTPKPDLPIPRPVRALFRSLPVTQRAARWANSAFIEYVGAGLLYFRQAPWILGSLEALSTAHLRVQVRDRSTREALTPDYNFFCKRPTFSNAYFRTFNRDDVVLVTAPIQEITERAVVTTDGAVHEVDVIVLATGFALQEDGNFPPFPTYGRDGIELGQCWREHGYESYEGLTISGFPNLFSMNSPFAFTGLSFFYQAESQMAHMSRVITEMRRRDCITFEVKPHAQQRFVEKMDRAAEDTVWHRGSCGNANSYYVNEHGQTRLGRLEPTLGVMWQSRHFPLADYRFDLLVDPLVRTTAVAR